jgi:putative transposase
MPRGVAKKKPKKGPRRRRGSAREPVMRQGVLFSEAGWGGKRKNAGAKPKPGAGVPHDRREDFKNRGVHVTLKLMREFNGLRHAPESELVRKVLRASSTAPACSGVRLLHYSIQWDHLHLIVEARDAAALSAAMKSLSVRLAKGLNRLWKRKGPVFVDRYHSHVLRSPHEIRQALRYVLCNANKHRVRMNEGPDPLSSGKAFPYWTDVDPASLELDPCIQTAKLWMLREGWPRFHPRFSSADVPEQRRRTPGYRKAERRLRRGTA